MPDTLLAIDIGNTHTVLGLFADGQLTHQWRVATAVHRTTDEIGLFVYQLMQRRGVDTGSVTAAIIACVVPALQKPYQDMVRREFGVDPLTVGPGIKTGMRIHYEDPREVGADRIVNGVAAYDRVKGPVIVVDFGTATTFDCINEAGDYLGGVIAPGIHGSMDALFRRAAKLPRVAFEKPPEVIGRTTVHSMQAGLVYGYVEMVDGIVRRIKQSYDGDPRVLATGGLATVIEPESATIEQACEDLTLHGLRLIYERNRR